MKTYICPMHPEVIQNKPGQCPKCGMNLEPMHKGAHGGHENMEENFRKRFFITLPLTLIVLLLSPHIQDWFKFSIDFTGKDLILFTLTSIIVLWAGLPFYQMARGEIQTRAFGMMTLVSLAVLAGYFFSVAATFLFPGESLYWEISTLVLAFLFGHWMEMRAVRGATGALSELAKLIPPSAHKLEGGNVIDVETTLLKKDDLILVRPGEKIPIDGVVVEGESSVNQSMITGESAPIVKKQKDEVIGGTINSEGSLTIKVTKTGKDSAISQMMELVRSAKESKPRVQKLADQAAKALTFAALSIGVGAFLYWTFGSPQGVIFASTLAISVIVIACPHALGLAIPTVTTITTSLAAKNGILIKNMEALEIARRLSYIIFDKTGTLTEGKFAVAQVNAIEKLKEDAVLQVAASVEYHSQHPLAQAIIDEAKKRKVNFKPAQNFKSFPGKGASGKVGDSLVLVGNKILFKENGIKIDQLERKINKEGKTFIWVVQDKKIIGAIGLADVIRPESKEAIDGLHQIGIKVAMLTGDHESVAKVVAKKLGIDTYFAQVLPEEKVNKVKELQNQGNIVAMVGDGVNDAPSLTQAHIGIAIGAGTAVAVESGDLVLMKNDPRDVVKAINLSRKTNSKMVQNLAWAAGYNIITIPLAAGVLYKSFGILLRPEWSALIMSASSVIVVANAILLRRERL